MLCAMALYNNASPQNMDFWLQTLPESKLSNVCCHLSVVASSELAAVFWPKILLLQLENLQAQLAL